MFYEGDKIGQYEIVEPLGSGGMATVYLANHPGLNRQVAIKVMHDTYQQDENFRVRFEREAQIVAKLEHPHIIPVYDYSDHEGKHYLVMKYVPGKSLRDVLDESPPLNLSEIIRILSPIADALTYAHQQGVVHRDVKPSNIVLDENEVPYLADFGLARLAVAGESTMSQDMLLGTPNYLSPEQAKGVKELDGRADTYSLGIIVYQILVGHVPFSGNTPFAVVHDHIYTAPPLPSLINPDIPESVEDVLLKVLAKEPDERYETTNKFIEALSSAVKKDNFQAVSVEHIQAAAESIAAYRIETDQIPVAIPKPSRNEETVLDSKSLITEYHFRFGRWWIIGGFISLFLFCGMSLSTVDSIREQGIAIENEMIQTAILSNRDQIMDMLPVYSVAEAQQITADAPDDLLPYLGAAHNLWSDDRPDEAVKVIEQGTDQAQDSADVFLILAGDIALDNNEALTAVQLYIRAYDRAMGTSHEMTIQNEVARTLYTLAMDDMTFTPETVNAYREQLTSRTNPLVILTLARYTITLDQLDDTYKVLDSAESLGNDNSNFASHYYLVLGEYHLANGNQVQAESTWEKALDANPPMWIRERIDQLYPRPS